MWSKNCKVIYDMLNTVACHTACQLTWYELLTDQRHASEAFVGINIQLGSKETACVLCNLK